jgi:hypothetical protein
MAVIVELVLMVLMVIMVKTAMMSKTCKDIATTLETAKKYAKRWLRRLLLLKWL